MTLDPCPFCRGGAKIVQRDVEPQGDPYYGQKIERFVACTSCGCVMFDQYWHEGFLSDDAATEAWNARKLPEHTDDLLCVIGETIDREVALMNRTLPTNAERWRQMGEVARREVLRIFGK